MPNSNKINEKHIDDLLAFLPVFEKPDNLVKSGPRRKKIENGEDIYIITPPDYAPEVLEFFMRAGQPRWSDYKYNPHRCAKLIYNDEFIAGADLDEIKTLLTYCVRGERFSDGFWGKLIKDGVIVKILHRLEEIRIEL